MDAVEVAAKIKWKGKGIPKKEFTWKLGERVPRLDAREKTLGYGEYVDDMEVEGLLHASAVRSKYPRAKVLSIDIEKAKAEAAGFARTEEDVMTYALFPELAPAFLQKKYQ